MHIARIDPLREAVPGEEAARLALEHLMGPPRVTHGGRGIGQCALGTAPLLAPAVHRKNGMGKQSSTVAAELESTAVAVVVDEEATAMDVDAGGLDPSPLKRRRTEITLMLKEEDVETVSTAAAAAAAPEDDDEDDADDDGFLTDVAKYVLASQGRWSGSSAVSGELAAKRGELRHQLTELRRRGAAQAAVAAAEQTGSSRGKGLGDDSDDVMIIGSVDGSSAPGGNRSRCPDPALNGPAAAAGMLWADAYRPASTSEVVGDRHAARAVQEWLAAWQGQIAQEAIGGAALFTTVGNASTRAGGKKAGKGGRPKRRGRGRDNPGSDASDFSDAGTDDSGYSDNPQDDDDGNGGSGMRGRYILPVDRRGVPATGMLLTGPVGAGKTAAVYAAAREFGFQVLEVNTSQRRSGMEILAMFGEATQSRRFVHANGGCGVGEGAWSGGDTSVRDGGGGGGRGPGAGSSAAVGGGIAGLFGKKVTGVGAATAAIAAAAATKKKKKNNRGVDGGVGGGAHAKAARGRKRAKAALDDEDEDEDETEGETGGEGGGKGGGGTYRAGLGGGGAAGAGASNTLILFEEVDVLRGEDRGFMAALATLINTTKRPIVLTSNSPSLPSLTDVTHPGLGGNGGRLPLGRTRFKAAAAADAAAYASLVAAAEGVWVPPSAVAEDTAGGGGGGGRESDAARTGGDAGDVRKALHSAQFISTGAGRYKRRKLLSNAAAVDCSPMSEEPCGGLVTVSARLVADTPADVTSLEAQLPLGARRHIAAQAAELAAADAAADAAAAAGAIGRATERAVDVAAAKAERAARNSARIEQGVLGNLKRGSLGLTPVALAAPTAEAEEAAGASAAATTEGGAALLEGDAGSAGASPGDDAMPDASDAVVHDADVGAGPRPDSPEAVAEIDGMETAGLEGPAEAEAEADAQEDAKEEEAGKANEAEETEGTGAGNKEGVDGIDVAEEAVVPLPPGGWQRSLDEMVALAALAANLSAADALRCPASTGTTGPRRLSRFAATAAAEALGAAGEEDDEDEAKVEERGGADAVGEPRRTLGGGGDVSKEAAGQIALIAPAVAFAAIPAAPPSSNAVVTTTSMATGAGVITHASSAAAPSTTDLMVAAARLRELAECTGGPAVVRGFSGGGGGGGGCCGGEGMERAVFMARMARLQVANCAQALGRRRRRAQYLPAGEDTVRDLASLGAFGTSPQ